MPQTFVSRSMDQTTSPLTWHKILNKNHLMSTWKAQKRITISSQKKEWSWSNKPMISSDNFLERPPRRRSLFPHLICKNESNCIRALENKKNYEQEKKKIIIYWNLTMLWLHMGERTSCELFSSNLSAFGFNFISDHTKFLRSRTWKDRQPYKIQVMTLKPSRYPVPYLNIR